MLPKIVSNLPIYDRPGHTGFQITSAMPWLIHRKKKKVPVKKLPIPKKRISLADLPPEMLKAYESTVEQAKLELTAIHEENIKSNFRPYNG